MICRPNTHEQRPTAQEGFTLAELIIGAAVLAIAITALLGAFLGQTTLNEHARNLTWAMNDANRVMERLRQLNTTGGPGCLTPTSAVPAECGAGTAVCANWDAWVASTTGGGKSLRPDPANNEYVKVDSSGADPLTITVGVCWRHRGRIIGNCSVVGTALGDPTPPGTAVTSPALLSTLMTCRQ